MPPILSWRGSAHSADAPQIAAPLFTINHTVPCSSRRSLGTTVVLHASLCAVHHHRCAGFLQENAAELAELAFATLSSYDDAQSQKAVMRVLQTAMQQEPFLKAFAGALVRYEGPRASPQVGTICYYRGLLLPLCHACCGV